MMKKKIKKTTAWLIIISYIVAFFWGSYIHSQNPYQPIWQLAVWVILTPFAAVAFAHLMMEQENTGT